MAVWRCGPWMQQPCLQEALHSVVSQVRPDAWVEVVKMSSQLACLLQHLQELVALLLPLLALRNSLQAGGHAFAWSLCKL